MALVGIRYDIDTRSVKPAEEENNYGLNFGVGTRLGYFFIQNVFRNTELVARGTYFPNSKITSINFGFKFFLNVREFGDRY